MYWVRAAHTAAHSPGSRTSRLASRNFSAMLRTDAVFLTAPMILHFTKSPKQFLFTMCYNALLTSFACLPSTILNTW